MNTPVCIGRVTLFLQIYAIMVYWNKRNLQQGADIMGLFDTFKKLFHHPIDNTSAAEQTLPRGNDSPVKITFSREPPADSPSPDIVPLSVRLKKAVPTIRGLYPHEILRCPPIPD